MPQDKKKRQQITLACTDCKRRTYSTTKNRTSHPARMELRKYCRFCRTHVLHRETR